MNASYYIYSDSLEQMVIRSFYYKNKHYTWNDLDCVYYSDESEEDYFFEIPDNAVFGLVT